MPSIALIFSLSLVAAAGGNGEACYPNNTCNSGFDCTEGKCLPPHPMGTLGGACYPNNTCNAGSACQAGTCAAIERGKEGGACFPNRTCFDGFSCQEGTCQSAPKPSVAAPKAPAPANKAPATPPPATAPPATAPPATAPPTTKPPVASKRPAVHPQTQPSAPQPSAEESQGSSLGTWLLWGGAGMGVGVLTAAGGAGLLATSLLYLPSTNVGWYHPFPNLLPVSNKTLTLIGGATLIGVGALEFVAGGGAMARAFLFTE